MAEILLKYLFTHEGLVSDCTGCFSILVFVLLVLVLLFIQLHILIQQVHLLIVTRHLECFWVLQDLHWRKIKENHAVILDPLLPVQPHSRRTGIPASKLLLFS